MDLQTTVDHLLLENSNLRVTLLATESQLKRCQQPTLSTSPHEDVYYVLEEFISIFTKQYIGLAVGACGAIIFRFLDQKVASRFAKKYNISQKELTKAAFPTLICFVQYILRKRSRNSRLAALLSLVKRQNKTNDQSVSSKSTASSKKSHMSTPKPLTSKNSHMSTPKPLTSQSSFDSENDSVFSPSNTTKTKRSRQSVSARFVKNSHMSIKIPSSSNPN